MSRWCDHVALTAEEVDVLLEAAEGGDGALKDWFQDVGHKKKKPWAFAEDKVWELVHRCLTRNHQPTATPWNTAAPLSAPSLTEPGRGPSNILFFPSLPP